jgi:hypothetical protein
METLKGFPNPPTIEALGRRAGRATRARLGALVLLATAVAGSAGCGGSFDPYNRLKSLRVLGIRSEPVAPATGETTTIDAKVYTLPGHDVTYAWSWCPFAAAPGAACPISEADASALAGVPVSYTLPTAADGSTTFTNAIPPPILATLCQGMGNITQPDCTDGFPIQLQLTVTTSDDAVQAVRPMRLRFRDADQPNVNPTVMGLFATLGDPPQPQPFEGDPPPAMPTLPRNKATVISTVVPDGTSESYMGKDNNNNPAQVNEILNLSWFVESGDTDHMRTAYIAGQVTLEDASKIKWTPALKKDYPADTSKVILIIRDDRNGEGWTEGTVTLEPTP